MTERITEHAAAGLHQLCFDVLAPALPAGAAVLDIAAGAGAFTARLQLAGYRTVANDFDHSLWELPGRPLAVDLDAPVLAELGSDYDAVVAIEVIEHLENPAGFLRACRDLLRPGGLLLLTTPNLSDWHSRLLFLRSGTFHHFAPALFAELGHVSVVPPWLLETHIARAGFRVVSRDAVLPLDPIGRGAMRLAVALLGPLLKRAMRPDGPFTRAQLDGDILVYLLRRAE